MSASETWAERSAGGIGAGDLTYLTPPWLPSEQSVGQQLVCVCVCVCALPGKRAYQHADHIDWKIGRKKVRRAKPGNLQNERRGLFWCVFAFLSVLVKGELLNGSGGEEHLKLIEALRKTHTRSHNKKKGVCGGGGGELSREEEEEFKEETLTLSCFKTCAETSDFCTGNKWKSSEPSYDLKADLGRRRYNSDFLPLPQSFSCASCG